jgi:hypothetical protein
VLKLAQHRNPLPHPDRGPRFLGSARARDRGSHLTLARAFELAQNFPGRRIHRRNAGCDL